MPQPKPATSFSQHLPIILITLVALVMRLWGLKQYAPLYWDEAQYLLEVERITPFFSVNVGTYAFLKLSFQLTEALYYPQIVGAIFGMIVVFGLYRFGVRFAKGTIYGRHLGLLMAAQGAIMPYFLKYSRTGLTEGFALAFFVIALNLYCDRLRLLDSPKKTSRLPTWLLETLSIIALIMVPTCSFKFLFPTLLIFMIWELLLFQRTRGVGAKKRGPLHFAGLLMLALISFLLLPLALSFISGYEGWLDRAINLSEWHASMSSFRMAFHFLIPVHLYYLGGVGFALFSLVGTLFLFNPKSLIGLIDWTSFFILASGFTVYLLFYGCFSHLQGSRMYVLTLPFLVFASSCFIVQVVSLLHRYRVLVTSILLLALFIPMSVNTVSYLKAGSGLQPGSQVIAKNLKKDELIFANAKSQVGYLVFHSPYHKVDFAMRSFMYDSPQPISSLDSIVVVINDPSDIVSTVASLSKSDRLPTIDSTRALLRNRWELTAGMKVIYRGSDHFFATPVYYLEDLYSWESFLQIRQLMTEANDSIFAYKR